MSVERGAPRSPLRARAARLAPLLPFVLAAFPARASEREKTSSGVPLVWPRPELEYDVRFDLDDPAGQALSEATRRALDAWGSALAGRVVPTYRGPAERAVRGDGRVTIALETAWDPADGDVTRALAFTALRYDAATGAISDADLALNGATFVFASGEPGVVDTESVVLHELGHALGLAHTCGDPGATYPSCFDVPDVPPGHRAEVLEAVMAPTLSVGARRRVLRADDLAGLRAIYGIDGSAVAPHLDALARVCPSGRLVLRGVGFPAEPRVEARLASGVVEDLVVARATTTTITLAGDPPPGDLVVTDPASRAYASLVAPAVPDACPRPVSPEAASSGCVCSTAPRSGLALPLALGLALLRTRRRRAVLVGLLVAGVGLEGRALAYKCSRVGGDTGPSLFWDTRTVPWYANAALSDDVADHDAALEQVKLGYQAWTDVGCSDLTLAFQGAEPGLVAGYDDKGGNKNVVVFVESRWAYDPGVIAVTTNAFDTHTGRILDSDIEVNGESFHFTIADDTCDPRSGLMDIRNTITHEVGHVIGLDHPPNTTRYRDTTMYASAPPCETKKRSLEADDIDGLCNIYPAGEATHQCFSATTSNLVEREKSDGFGGCSDVRAPRSRTEDASSVVLLLGAALAGRFVGRARGPRTNVTGSRRA